MRTFAIAIRKQNDCNNKLGYGVMVTLQILVLSFLVRVRVSQQRDANLQRFAFFVLYRLFVWCCQGMRI